MRHFVLPVFLLLTTGHCASAATLNDCESNEMRNSDVACLVLEYKEAERLLVSKTSQLIGHASQANPGVSNSSLLREMQLATIKAIESSSKSWKQTMEAECGVLLAASYGTGSGAEPAAVQCRIDRTYERIKYLSAAKEYEWLWQR